MLPIPDGLPLPLQEGYAFSPVSPVSSTQMITGRSLRRRIYRSTPTRVSVTWLLTDKQAQLFEGWYRWGVNAVDWFLCPIKSPMGLKMTKAQFVDIYTGPALVSGRLWRYTAELELFDLPVPDEATFLELLLGMPVPQMNAAISAELQRWYTKSWPGAQLT